MKKAFVISDIHGCYDQLMILLEHWDKEMELVILGDLIDRGDKSLKVVQQMMNLIETYGDKITVLKGNHEDMFLNFLDDPIECGRMYDMVGGGETIISFVDDSSIMKRDIIDISRVVQQKASREVAYIKKLPLYYEFGDVLFVHAGINPLFSDWRNSSENDFMWDREMIRHKNETGLTIVFGHTPTRMLREDTNNNDIWVSRDGSYIGIDGGCVFGGQLNAIVINEKGVILEHYSVKG
ncbi:metallophosphoesterase family protein [Bacillus massiliigorillae]|uniref:metallophosphoesterase family protein n=1 Tax=Bacillus massiliigorillae TaxID=1243664 RepID=UPI0003A2F07E|nr:metallophosphoesterase family protein [Bacillus massiliigorillae]